MAYVKRWQACTAPLRNSGMTILLALLVITVFIVPVVVTSNSTAGRIAQDIGQPLAVQHPILVVDHGDHGVVRVQINSAKLHFSLLNGSVERCIPTLDPGRPLLWAARRPFNDYQLDGTSNLE
ncbi:hypothetical protein WN982_11065 [Paraburkholderia sp. IMGN_8]|uniref:hypothetical protein n=1 Tax=Paraburkholderia sp. IMGN_8 TaxID=3136564 RepID=UPI003100F816